MQRFDEDFPSSLMPFSLFLASFRKPFLQSLLTSFLTSFRKPFLQSFLASFRKPFLSGILDRPPLGSDIVDMLIEPAPLLFIHLQAIEFFLQRPNTGGGKFV